jgi:hypothetical protein
VSRGHGTSSEMTQGALACVYDSPCHDARKGERLAKGGERWRERWASAKSLGEGKWREMTRVSSSSSVATTPSLSSTVLYDIMLYWMHFHKECSVLHLITSELEKVLRAKFTDERSHNGNAATRSLVRLSPLPDAGSFGSRKTEWRSSEKQVLQQKVNCRGGSTPHDTSLKCSGGSSTGTVARSPGDARAGK